MKWQWQFQLKLLCQSQWQPDRGNIATATFNCYSIAIVTTTLIVIL